MQQLTTTSNANQIADSLRQTHARLLSLKCELLPPWKATVTQEGVSTPLDWIDKGKKMYIQLIDSALNQQ